MNTIRFFSVLNFILFVFLVYPVFDLWHNKPRNFETMQEIDSLYVELDKISADLSELSKISVTTEADIYHLQQFKARFDSTLHKGRISKQLITNPHSK